MVGLNELLDLILPEKCSFCQESLALKRNKKLNNTPLCNNCIRLLKNNKIKTKYKQFKFCKICGYPLTSEDSVCMRCREKKWAFVKSESLYFYEDIKQVVFSYKFKNRKGLSLFFADLIYEYYKTNLVDYYICPVPFRPSAKRKRGWDQIEAITMLLSKKYKLPVKNCLKRANGKPQKIMNYQERLINLNEKISLKKETKSPFKVLLIDDVFTTGATMDACSKILKKSGTQYIQCLSIALDV